MMTCCHEMDDTNVNMMMVSDSIISRIKGEIIDDSKWSVSNR